MWGQGTKHENVYPIGKHRKCCSSAPLSASHWKRGRWQPDVGNGGVPWATSNRQGTATAAARGPWKRFPHRHWSLFFQVADFAPCPRNAEEPSCCPLHFPQTSFCSQTDEFILYLFFSFHWEPKKSTTQYLPFKAGSESLFWMSLFLSLCSCFSYILDFSPKSQLFSLILSLWFYNKEADDEARSYQTWQSAHKNWSAGSPVCFTGKAISFTLISIFIGFFIYTEAYWTLQF